MDEFVNSYLEVVLAKKAMDDANRRVNVLRKQLIGRVATDAELEVFYQAKMEAIGSLSGYDYAVEIYLEEKEKAERKIFGTAIW